MTCVIGASVQTGASTTLRGVTPIVAMVLRPLVGETAGATVLERVGSATRLRIGERCRVFAFSLSDFRDERERVTVAPEASDCVGTGGNRNVSLENRPVVPPVRVGAAVQTHDEPWLQAPVPVEGQLEKSHTNPHAPQL